MSSRGPLGTRWRNLGTAAGAVAAVPFAAFDVYQWWRAFAGGTFLNDFTFYFAAARIGVSHGWRSIYDLQLLQVELDAMGSGIKIAALARYISPPPVAWIAAPLTALPYPIAYWTWSALLLAALGLTWHLASPGSGRTRVIYLAAAIGWLPAIYALQLGQPNMLVALGVAACYALLRSGRSFWAGLAMGALALKPQLAYLVPAALLVSGRTRAFWGSVLALGLLAAASAIALGPTGIAAYEARLAFAAGVPVNRELTLAPLLGNLSVTRAVQVAVAIWALALVYRMRRRGPEWTFIPVLVGGLLASPYAHLDDFAMLGLAGWLYLRTPAAAWTWAYALAVAVAVEGEPFWGPFPTIAAEFVSLVLISVEALKVDGRLERDGKHVVADGPAEPVDERARQA